MSKKIFTMFFFCLLMMSLNTGCNSQDSYAEPSPEAAADEELTGLPVDIDSLVKMDYEIYGLSISNADLHNVNDGDTEGLSIDLNNTDLWGRVHTGPYPFEAGDSEYDYTIFRLADTLSDGKATLPIKKLYTQLYDSNSWLLGGRSTATPTIAYRIELFSEKSIKGMFGSFVSFQKNEDGTFQKMPTIIEGPFVTQVCSDNPTTMEIVWRTDEACNGRVHFGEHLYYGNQGYVNLHVVLINNLTPDTYYEYYVKSDDMSGRTVVSNTYHVRTAPPKGKSDITFVYTSDSYRESGGVGGGERDYMGCNMEVLGDIAANSYRDGAEFMIFGGDLIYGYSTNKDDMILQYRAWKQIVSGFWHSRAIYPGMGNHEFLMNVYEPFFVLDRWPYETDSSEAVFAQEFYNPSNGPEKSDARRPSYKENVYSFQYGSVLTMSVNTCYWLSDDWYSGDTNAHGGAPLGYIMEDQLLWIEEMLESAEKDHTIKYIFLFTHAPILPYMKHVGDGLWWNGDNNVRAKTRTRNADSQEYELQPDELGMIEVRDRLLKAITTSTKVAAFFSSHEHGYHRTLISKYTPLGVYPDDDIDGDGVLDQYSPNPNLTNPTWHIMCGGAGSGFNAEELENSPPWKPQRSTSHTGYVLIETSENKVGMKFIGGPSREVMDQLDDLMAVKNQ
jgi:3',5'-cyclic AMP phosphodiesterase CpdA